MEQIRVLHEIAKLDAGGVESLIMNIYRHIDKSKVQFDFLVHRQDGFYEEEVCRLGGKIFRAAPFNPIKHYEYLKSMDDFFKNHPEYLILHAHSDLNFWPLMIARKNGVPVRIAHSHNVRTNFNLKLLFMYYQKLRINNEVTHRFACSLDAAKWAYGAKVNPNDVTIVKNGIVIENFLRNQQVRDEYRKKLNLENKFVVGHVGRMVPQKNHEFLIEIFKNICEICDDARLVLVGDGPLAKQIQKKVNALGMERKVSFLGLRNDVNQIMQTFDAFVFPSIFEGLGIVALESQAAGVKTYCSEAVPADVDLTDYLFHIKLNEGPKAWANRIIQDRSVEYNTSNTFALLKNAGYDIVDVSKKMEKFYLEQWNEHYGK